MTEDEAKTKWCPFTRVGMNGGVAMNRDFDEGGSLDAWPLFKAATACIGSGCMAWRWEPQLYEHHSNDFGKYINSEEDTNRHGVKGKALPRHGYCGLAGRP
jgi:hypothetical protein